MADLDDDKNPAKNPGEWDESTGKRRTTIDPSKMAGKRPGQKSPPHRSSSKPAASAGSNSESSDSSPDDNINEARQAESGDENSDNASGSEKNALGETSSLKGKMSSKFSLSSMKKKGPIAFVVSFFVGAGTIFMFINSPGLLLVQIKEVLFNDLMDAVASMDARSKNIVKARINDKVVGKGCSKLSLMRCKYKGMSKKQLEKLRAAGIDVETSGRTVTGKYKVRSMKVAGTPPGEDINPKNYKKTLASNDDFRARMTKAYSPRWAMIKDDIFKKISKKYKISLKRNVGGETEEDVKKKMNKDIKEGNDGNNKRGGRVVTDEDGKTHLEDGAGNRLTDGQGGAVDGNEASRLSDSSARSASTDIELTSKKGPISGVSSAATKVVGGLNAFTGSEAFMCGIYKTLRSAGTVSRNLKYAQLIRYVIPFFNTADSIKNGTATPVAVSALGNMLTKQDLRKKVPDDGANSIDSSDSLLKTMEKVVTASNNPEPVDNQDYGKAAAESAGIKTAAYGETTNLSPRDSKFSHSSSTGSKFNGIAQQIKNNVNTSKCSLYTNTAFQFGMAALSLGLVTVSCLPINPLASATCSTVAKEMGKGIFKSAVWAVFSMLLTNWIMNQIELVTRGALVTADLTGVDAGNALFSGAAAVGGTAASARGMQPLSTHDEVTKYQVTALRNRVDNYRVDQLLARDTPFDVYNSASFLGSMVWSVSPQVRASSKTLAGIISLPLTMLGDLPQWLIPGTHAATISSIDRYSKNDSDEIFQGMANDAGKPGLEGADIMGNLRYGMTDEQLNADPTKIVEWMIDARQVDADSGEVLKTEEALNAAACIPPSRPEEISYLGFDDEMTLAQHQEAAKYASYELPYPAGGRENAPGNCSEGASPEARLSDYASNNPEKDVRTYAHFLRYCRMGIEGGRAVAFGDLDGGEDEGGFLRNTLNGLSEDEWASDGRECLRSNTCKAGQDPNGMQDKGDERWTTFCRPSYYDIYAVYTMDNGDDGKSGIGDSMEKDDEEKDDETGKLGESKEMAKKVLAEKNIELLPQTRSALQKFADTGEATNACGEKFSINPLLSWVMLENAKKYKISVNNFGFKEDRNLHECIATSGYQHPRGNAIDIQGIALASAASTNGGWGAINYSGSQVQLVTDYAADWMNALATKEPTRGRSGQLGCGGYSLLSHPDRNKWKGPNGNLHFDDSCDHLHIEVADREDVKKDDKNILNR